MLAERSGQEVIPSYVDTLRSRAYRTLHRQVKAEGIEYMQLATNIQFSPLFDKSWV